VALHAALGELQLAVALRAGAHEGLARVVGPQVQRRLRDGGDDRQGGVDVGQREDGLRDQLLLDAGLLLLAKADWRAAMASGREGTLFCPQPSAWSDKMPQVAGTRRTRAPPCCNVLGVSYGSSHHQEDR